MKLSFAILAAFSTLTCAHAADPARIDLTQRVIVQFHQAPSLEAAGPVRKEQAQAESVRSLGERTSLRLVRVRETVQGAVVVQLPAAVTADEARETVTRLADDPAVAHAEVDVRVYAHQVADPFFASQWNLPGPADGSIAGINVTRVWPMSDGGGVTVAVVDTGSTGHSDLDAAWLPGYDFISADPSGSLDTANDGDGRDTDAADPGDWCSANGSDRPSSWHGTAVASVIAAQANGYGIVGAAPGVRILPVRAIGRCGGYMSDVIDAMRWAAGLTVAGVGANPYPAKVLNVSLGSMPGTRCSTLQQQAVDEIAAANVMVVAAAGNEGVGLLGSPANCSQVVAVAAHLRDGSLAPYSNYQAGITLTAPGGSGSSSNSGILASGNRGTKSPGAQDESRVFVGTSAATPHVAAAAALLWSQDPARPLIEIRNALTGGARPWPAGTPCVSGSAVGGCGAGMLDVVAAMGRIGRQVGLDIASPPSSLPGNAEITLSARAQSLYAPSQLTWRWVQTSGSPAALTDADTATVRITLPPFRTTVGLRVTVTDPTGAQTIDDTRVNVNNAPVAQALEPISARLGDAIVRQAVAADPDGDSVRYTLLQGPAGMRVGRSDGRLQWTADVGGSGTARIAVEDAEGLRGTDLELQFEVAGAQARSTASPLASGTGSGGGGAFGWVEVALLAFATVSLRQARSRDPVEGRPAA